VSLGFLRGAALITLAGGALGSLALMLQAGQRTPGFLLVIFVFWVLSPFAALAAADLMSKRWSTAIRIALYGLMLVIGAFSLVAYSTDALRPRTAGAAFTYVIVPPVSWLFMTIVLLTAALKSRRRKA
jgi:hypothetical protein